MRRNDFMLAYDGFDPSAEGLREALTSTGNGYLCMRGAAEWEDADDTHYPGTLGRLTRSRHPGQVDRVLVRDRRPPMMVVSRL
jgi:hypothetical protein